MAAAEFRPPLRLLDLPPELVGNVCEHLTDESLQHVRKVCRTLKLQSTTAYGHRFFDHLVVMLHPTSLTIFLEISQHSDLAKFVRRVSISGERIGYSITPIDDQELHEDLQLSIEQSGLDSIILKAALNLLTNLTTIRIDTLQFFSGSDAANYHPGIACGRMHICKFLSPACIHRALPGDNDYNRVYILVLKVIEETGLCTRVNLEMSFCVTLDDRENHVPGYFDLQSPVWKDHASKKIRYIEFTGDIDPNWTRDLLLSASDLRRLDISFPEICIDEESSRVCHGFSHSFNWPSLARVRLEELITTHSTFVGFLVAHQDTLEHLWLSVIGFPQGTWSEPLTAISTIPKLKFLFLQRLLERQVYSDRSAADGMLQLGENCLNVEGIRNVARATKVLCSKLAAVTSPDDPYQGEEGEYYPSVVDLRKGIAASLE